MGLQQPLSPLDRIPNLEPVDPEKVRELEEHLAAMVLPKVWQRQREDAARSEEIRRVILD